MIPKWHLQEYQQALYLQTLFRLAGIDCVFDVGANVGQYRDFLRDQVGYAGHIVSFVPLPGLAHAMRIRAKADSRWTVREVVLGRASGSASFNVPDATQFSSFLEPKSDFDVMFERNRSVRSINVPVETLDREFNTLRSVLGFTTPCLKLDTQGFDLEVVAGGAELIGEFAAVQTEASVRVLYEGMSQSVQTIAAITASGFEVSAIFPNNPAHVPELFEFDCHFVASKRIEELRQRHRKKPVWR